MSESFHDFATINFKKFKKSKIPVTQTWKCNQTPFKNSVLDIWYNWVWGLLKLFSIRAPQIPHWEWGPKILTKKCWASWSAWFNTWERIWSMACLISFWWDALGSEHIHRLLTMIWNWKMRLQNIVAYLQNSVYASQSRDNWHIHWCVS